MLLDPRYVSGRSFDFFHFDVVSSGGSKTVRSGFRPDPYFEVRLDGEIASNKFVVPEMVCFCDIPQDKLGIHTNKYSPFGIAFRKEFLIKQGANPVMYVARDAATPLQLVGEPGEFSNFFANEDDNSLLASNQERGHFLEKLKRRLLEMSIGYSEALQKELSAYRRDAADASDLRERLLINIEFLMGSFCYLFGLLKTFDPSLPDSHPDNYYMEREWRVLGRVHFTTDDISTLVIPEGFKNRLKSDLPGYRGGVHTL